MGKLEVPMGKSCVFHGIMEGFPWPPLMTRGESHAAHCCAAIQHSGSPRAARALGFLDQAPPARTAATWHVSKTKSLRSPKVSPDLFIVLRLPLKTTFFLALMSMGACAASVASASRIDGWKWSVFGWLWDGENAMRCVNKTADLTTGTSVTPSLRFFFSWCVFPPFSRWQMSWKMMITSSWSNRLSSDVHEAFLAALAIVTLRFYHARAAHLWGRLKSCPRSQEQAGRWPPGSSDSICRTSDYVYIYILIIHISNLSHTHIYISNLLHAHIYI